MILRAPARAAAVFCCLFLLMAAFAGKTCASDLKGYSIDLIAGLYATFRDISGGRPAGESTVHWTLYFGRSGNVFVYRQYGLGTEQGLKDKLVVSPGKAVTLGPARMMTVSVDGDQVMLIVKQIEGFVVHTFVVDPGRARCSYAISLQPDPATGRVMSLRTDGTTGQELTVEARSSACIVKPGNIFADDQ